MGNVIKMPLYRFFHQAYIEIKKKQDDIKRKKIEFLYQEAYHFFLDSYLMKIAEKGAIDFPPYMYETGKIICQEAQNKAEQALLAVIEADKVNYCYTKRIRQIKNLLKSGN